MCGSRWKVLGGVEFGAQLGGRGYSVLRCALLYRISVTVRNSHTEFCGWSSLVDPLVWEGCGLRRSERRLQAMCCGQFHPLVARIGTGAVGCGREGYCQACANLFGSSE